MIAIYSHRHDENSNACRLSLLAAGIPCFLIGPAREHADVAVRVPFVLFPDADHLQSVHFGRKLSFEKILTGVDPFLPDGIADGVKIRYFQRFGHDYEAAAGDGIRFFGREVYFRGHFLCLTDSEYLIIRLLFHSRAAYFSSDEIAAACFEKETGAVSGHVCNINRKARLIMNMPLIETRRSYGYRIL